MRSFSEIETISKRASRGAGFSWGVSEEIGKSVRLLEMFGLPGILYLKSYLERISNQNFQKITLISYGPFQLILFYPFFFQEKQSYDY